VKERRLPKREAIVAIVDDDLSFREGVSSLVRAAGWRVETFASAEEFLARPRADPPSCLLLDLQLPDLNGLDLQKRIAEGDLAVPIVFISGHGDIPATVRAMKAGAVEFLTKPFDKEQLFCAIAEAMARDRHNREELAQSHQVRQLYSSLTQREKQVMQHVVFGLLNKQIAAELTISEFTVKLHRGRVMRKMHAKSLADLVRMAERLGLRSRQRL
jgi:FixJ family two-component response regulator